MGSPTSIAYGDGYVGVSDGFGTTGGAGAAVVRYDAAGRCCGHAAPKIIDVSGAGSIAFGFGSLWVADSLEDEVLRIDPALGSVVGPPIAVGRDPESLAVGPSAVWVVNKLDATLTRIDPRNNTAGSATGLGVAPDSVSADASGVWVASATTNTLVHIDSASGQIVSIIKAAAGPVAVALDEGNVWVADVRLTRLNGSTHPPVNSWPRTPQAASTPVSPRRAARYGLRSRPDFGGDR
jgi:streptogramin lyase